MKVKELKQYLEKLNNNHLICIRDFNHPNDYYELKFEDLQSQKDKC